MPSLIQSVVGRLATWVSQRINHLVKAICRPAQLHILTSAVLDLSRSKLDLIAENALLRYQLVLLKRAIKRPTLKPKDRLSLLLAKVTRTWRQVLFIVQPATLLRWHREGFRLFWRLKSKPLQRQLRLSTKTIGLIRQMVFSLLENDRRGEKKIAEKRPQ